MEKDDQDRIKQTSAASRTGSTPYATSFKLAALAVTLVSVATATGFLAAPFLRPQEARPEADAAPGTQADEGAPLFRGWPKPDVALILTGEQHGYLQRRGRPGKVLGHHRRAQRRPEGRYRRHHGGGAGPEAAAEWAMAIR